MKKHLRNIETGLLKVRKVLTAKAKLEKGHRFLFVLFGLYFLVSIKGSAQDSISQGQDAIKSSKTHIWLNLGLGIEGNRRSDWSVSELGSLSLQKAFYLITLKYMYAFEFKFMGGDILSSYNLMYGLIIKSPPGYQTGYFSVSTGINYSTLSDVVKYGSGTFDYNIFDRKRFGVPVDLQFFLQGKWIGMGLNGYIVINSEFTFGGVLVCLQLGNLK